MIGSPPDARGVHPLTALHCTALHARARTHAHAQVFKRHPLELQVVLRMVKKSPSELDDDFVDYMGCTTAQVGRQTHPQGLSALWPAQLRPTRTSG